MAYNYYDLMETTIDLYRGRLTDNAFDRYPTLAALESHSAVRLDGGQAIVEHVEIGDSTDNVVFFSGDAELSVVETNLVDQATYSWQNVACMWYALRDELAKNASSKAGIVKLLSTRLKNLEKSFGKVLNQGFYTAQVGDAFLGLPDIISEGDALGDIDGSVVSNWNAYVDTIQEDANASNIGPALRGLITGTNWGGGTIDAIWAPYELFNLYREYASEKVQLSVSDVANLGFKGEAAIFDGVPIIADRDVTANTFYGVNYDSISFVKHSQLWLTPGERFGSPRNQRIEQTLYSMGNVTCRERRANGKVVFAGAGN